MSASDWLSLAGETIVVVGVANRRSVGYAVGRHLRAAGAEVVWVVHTDERRRELARLLDDDPVYVCDVTQDEQLDALGATLAREHRSIGGLVHSVAFADYSSGWQPFHRTERADFLRAVDTSAFSLIALARALEDVLARGASVVTISISTTRMAAENYGYMGPVKAALDSSVAFLAKSLAPREVRVNAVCAGLLKTSSSAGIPGYLESYLYAERCTLRKRALETDEVANAVLFLLSPRSSGINAKGVVVDAGMDINYFDAELIERVNAPPPE